MIYSFWQILYPITLCLCLIPQLPASIFTGSSTNNANTASMNFYGTIEDRTRTAQIESILIGGRSDKIPVYQNNLPTDLDQKKEQKATRTVDPKQNRVFLDLKEIKSIALQYPESPTISTVEINLKSYLKIVVEYITGTKKDFLIETNRKVTCKELDKSTNIADNQVYQQRDLNFIHVKKITIIGYKSNTQQYQTASTNIQKISKLSDPILIQQKKQFQADLTKIFATIENNIVNLNIENPTAIITMRETLLILVKSLQDQLQKFLDMVK